MTRYLIILLLLFLSISIVNAGNSGWTTISQFYAWDDGAYIMLENGVHNTESCGKRNWVHLPKSSDVNSTYKETDSAFLSAFVSQKDVLVYMESCTASDFSKVKGVQIKR